MKDEPNLSNPNESFWRSTFSDLPDAGLLRGTSSRASDRLATLNASVSLPLALPTSTDALVKKETVLAAAWSVVLSRHTGSPEVLFFGSFPPIPEFIPVRLKLPVASPCAEWLVELEKWLAQAAASGPLPAELAQQAEKEGLPRRLTNFVVESHGNDSSRDRLRSSLLVRVLLKKSLVEIHYDAALFAERDVTALGHHFNSVLEGIDAQPETPVGKLPVLTTEERRRLLHEWNDTATLFAADKCIHDFFAEQVARTPDAVAVVFLDQQWTYRELDERAEMLARRLKSAGVGPGSFVAICLSRSLELMAALLAVFKAGGAYLPLDPTYPTERLAFMIADAKPAVIVVSQKTESLFAGADTPLFFVEEGEKESAAKNPATDKVQSSDAAYVLYTSGSTGKPKGVVITHRNVSNFFTAMDGVIGTTTGVWLAVTSISFDISVLELFWTLARGFRVILQEEGQWVSQSGSQYSLPEQVKRHGVTHLQCTPSLAAMLLRDPESVKAVTQLRRFMIGGEPLPLDVGQRLAEIVAGDLINLYGPTETTVWSSSQRITAGEKQILIGRPVANNRMYLLDAEHELVPPGCIGELYIGGDGLAREYLHRPEITRERFITHSFLSGETERLYRTGDLVRHTPDGRLEFMGRIDQQIKIRGVRLELGEIESILRDHPDVRDAVVTVRQDQAEEKRLVAYVIAKTSPAPSTSNLQQWMASKLPEAVVPSAIVFLAEFPRTPNGKLDRLALPKPVQAQAPSTPHGANDLERTISSIWAEALGIKSVGVEDRFFDIGGHSLLMVEVHDRLRDKLGHEVPLLDLFRFPTVRSLAQHLSQPGVNAAVPISNAGARRGRLQLRQRPAVRSSGSLRRTGSLKKPT
jgi:amino acid adenylation domain-containing protein